MKTLEFYKNLPKKTCVNCGEVIQEQCESYLFECEKCLRLKEE